MAADSNPIFTENPVETKKPQSACNYTSRPKKSRLRAPPRPRDSVHKRCPSCNTHLYVMQTDNFMHCWKCGKKLKITHALRSSTFRIGGIILSVVE